MILQYIQLQSDIQQSFWHQLSTRKLDIYQLNDSKQQISAYYTPSTNRLYFSQQSFTLSFSTSTQVSGSITNTNTLGQFKSINTKELLETTAREIHESIISGSAKINPALLNTFSLITFADLKKYHFYYWLCIPALLPSDHYVLLRKQPLENILTPSQITSLLLLNHLQLDPFFIIKNSTPDSIEIAALRDFSNSSDQDIIFGFLDPSDLENNPGWPLRNFLFLLKTWNLSKVRILCLRNPNASFPSFFLDVELPGESPSIPQFVGWEKNTIGKLGPRMADLASLMDPVRLAETAVDLNLKLMKWRAMPALPLEKISKTKCLLFGAGTLGCYTARALMAWGVRHITFVDNGKVSLSNPVRQPLFNFDDSINGGKPKAQTAANNLKLIFPGMTTIGYDLTIPMPGHPMNDNQETRGLLKTIEELIEAHDAIFLLTDSRESRWLPSLIGRSMDKIVMNAALGFDSYLVMRHGVTGTELGCYYCNDVVAPMDSLKDRTLDQQCTVTRPGLSLLASSLVVELFISLISHPNGALAPADTNIHPSESVEHAFGLIPHQIRGFLTHFSNLLVTGNSFEKCTACSSNVLNAYKENGHDFLISSVNDPKSLQKVAGLDELYISTKDIDVEWDEDSVDAS